MRLGEQVLQWVLLVGWIPGLIWGWNTYVRVRKQPSWRGRVSKVLIIGATVLPLVIFIAAARAPNLDVAGGWEKFRPWARFWSSIVDSFCIVLLVGSFFARARLIAPLCITAVSLFCVWMDILAMA